MVRRAAFECGLVKGHNYNTCKAEAEWLLRLYNQSRDMGYPQETLDMLNAMNMRWAVKAAKLQPKE
jgi:hypothetical protein